MSVRWQAWSSHCDTHGVTARNCNYQAAYAEWLADNYSAKYKTAQVYQKAKALNHNLVKLECWGDWNNFFADRADFLNANLDTLTAVTAMHTASVLLIQNMVTSYTPKLMGVVLLEICKFCVRLLDTDLLTHLANLEVCAPVADAMLYCAWFW